MPQKVKKRASSPYRIPWLAVTAVMTLSAVVCAGAGILLYPFWYRTQVYPGVSVAGIPMGGLAREEAHKQIQHAVDAWERRGIRVEGFDKTVVISPFIAALDDPDLTYELVRFDVEAMTDEAWGKGRPPAGEGMGSWVRHALVAVGIRISPVRIPARYRIDGGRVLAVIESEFGRYESPAQDAGFIIADNAGGVEVRAERAGERIDRARASADLAYALEHFSSGPIRLRLIDDIPRINAAQVQSLLPGVSAALAKAPYRVILPPEIHDQLVEEFGSGTMQGVLDNLEVSRTTLAQWLRAAPGPHEGAQLALESSRVIEFLAPLAALVNRPAIDAKFEVKEGKVSEFQGSRDGRALHAEESIARMEDAFVMRQTPEAVLAIKELKANIQTAEVNTLGIKELLGRGTSNFSGSPKNRLHNIGVGVAAVNGTLIPPGEEFSLVKTLGDIDAEAGYLPELVIKGNRTIPEYGGGLCQIGTTAFRSALAAGLPIRERRNHSYRVRYYEPAGTDATIYGPSPDFRFFNDTGSHMLFQARTKGDDVVFELWGTADGRVATTTSPEIYNIVPPPSTKYVETTDLKPGEKRCTELAHSGADAKFTYTVTYASGEAREEVFKSHYRPWQAVCLIGVDKVEGEGGATVLPDPDSSGTRGQ